MNKTKLVGIINITPDSFSDGGLAFTTQAAFENIGRLIEEGADIIDIGAESTRPGATPLSAKEEWERLHPVLNALPRNVTKFSIDTRHATTAQKALDSGIDWINDVSGFSDQAMIEVVKNSTCKLVLMHSLSVPADKSIVIPQSQDPLETVLAFAKARIKTLEEKGIRKERIIFDPGIGFGKTAEQSFALLKRIAELKTLGVPLLIGHSRKSFLGNTGDRDDATLTISHYLADAGVDYLRVHAVARHYQMLALAGGLRHD